MPPGWEDPCWRRLHWGWCGSGFAVKGCRFKDEVWEEVPSALAAVQLSVSMLARKTGTSLWLERLGRHFGSKDWDVTLVFNCAVAEVSPKSLALHFMSFLFSRVQ